MRHRLKKLEVRLEYQPAPDAKTRLQAAYNMIWSKAAAAPEPQTRNLTKTEREFIMRHDDDCQPT